MIIKLNDLKKLHEEFRNELISAFEETLDKSDFIQGKNVTTFENDFAKFTGSNYAISCANGTDALIIALKALNLKNGAEVIVPALSWFSTASAVLINSEANLNMLAQREPSTEVKVPRCIYKDKDGTCKI